jgi:hypothetical protein
MPAIRSLITKWLLAGLVLSCSSLAIPSIAFAYDDAEQADPRRMIVPTPLRVPGGKSLAEVKDAIQKGINLRGWTGKEVTPNVIEATYDRKGNGKRILVVALTYDTNQIEMAYKDSRSLKYSVVNGEAQLHSRANGWMKNLASDIGRFLDQ